MMEDRKKCNTCDVDKPLKSFPKGRTRKDGVETRKSKCYKCSEATYIESKRKRQRLHAQNDERKAQVNKAMSRYRKTKKYSKVIEIYKKRKRLIKRWEERKEQLRLMDHLPLVKMNENWNRIKRYIYKRENPQCVCKECGSAYHNTLYWRNTSACSDTCLSNRKKKHTKKARRNKKKRFGNHKKRARYYGVKYEPVNRLRVYKRDNWTCVSCGIKVETTKEYAPHQASIDHIIPVSKGGSHTYSNVQTMCVSCNSMKGAT